MSDHKVKNCLDAKWPVLLYNDNFFKTFAILLCKLIPFASRQLLIFGAESSSRPY